jgi:hypothetical protein
MRKKGVFSFINYLLYLVLGGGAAIYVNAVIDKKIEAGGDFESVMLAGLLMLLYFAVIYGGVGVLLKGIHMISGWGLFGLVCMLLDFWAIDLWLNVLLPSGDIGEIKDMLFAIVPLIFSVISLISNALSLRKKG